MSELLVPQLELLDDDTRAGFRLRRLEVYNWGTFDERPYVVPLDGRNGLLTGEIGSGKSTLVDAVTTLLVPAHRVAYNKAAGAEAKERSLRTYVLGYYKSERSETSGFVEAGHAPQRAEPQRDPRGCSTTEGYDQTVTLAQVFWFRRADGSPPARLFVGFEGELGIARHFTDFGSSVADLRRNLRAAGAELWDSYPSYGAWFRRRFGHRGRPGARPVPPDGLDEVGRQPDRLRPQPHAATVRRRVAGRGADRALRRPEPGPRSRAEGQAPDRLLEPIVGRQ